MLCLLPIFVYYLTRLLFFVTYFVKYRNRYNAKVKLFVVLWIVVHRKNERESLLRLSGKNILLHMKSPRTLRENSLPTIPSVLTADWHWWYDFNAVLIYIYTYSPINYLLIIHLLHINFDLAFKKILSLKIIYDHIILLVISVIMQYKKILRVQLEEITGGWYH